MGEENAEDGSTTNLFPLPSTFVWFVSFVVLNSSFLLFRDVPCLPWFGLCSWVAGLPRWAIHRFRSRRIR